MDIRALECVVTVAETLHFRQAAQRLHLTQPALSQRIRVLEEEVGAPLFARDRRGVALTAAGAAFLEPARQAVAAARLARAQALRAERGETGRLRLGFTVIAFYGLLPEAVQQFRLRYPDVEVALVERDSPSLESALAAGDVDLAVLHPPLSTPGLVTHALPDEPLVLALPASHRLAARRRLSAGDLAGEPFLLAPRAVGPRFHDRVIAWFQSQGVSPRVVQEATPMTTLVGLVSAGAGLGFVTAGIARIGRPGVVFRALRPAAPRLPMAAAWHGPALTACGQQFLAVVDALYREAPR
jgi:DNA-binding transcriptional LysR family regulator